MKRSLFIALCFVFSLATYAQQDVVKFLGIPVDGSKSEMIRKLKEKGFQNDPATDALTGEFNGTEVTNRVATNNNKVCRIMVSDVNNIGERDIQIRFNKLCEQFTKNSKYTAIEDYTISEDEDISYEITVHKKRYEAVFYQLPILTDTVSIREKLQPILLSKYTKEQLADPTEEITTDIKNIVTNYFLNDLIKRPVWFMISEFRGKYYITMYYDNEYNRANGEDL